MKRLFICAIAICLGYVSAYGMEDFDLEMVVRSESSAGAVGPTTYRKTSRPEGSVFITNNKAEEVSVEWEVSLARHVRSAPGFEKVPEYTRNYKAAQKVNWIVDQQQALSAPVFLIRVCVYREGNQKQLLAEEVVEKTMSAEQLYGDRPAHNLYITIADNNNVTVYIGR